MTVGTIGLDLAKDVFQVHGISETGRKVFNKKIKRAKLLAFLETLPRCVVSLEACGSAHHWGRELRKLGHDVRLMPAAYVKPSAQSLITSGSCQRYHVKNRARMMLAQRKPSGSKM